MPVVDPVPIGLPKESTCSTLLPGFKSVNLPGSDVSGSGPDLEMLLSINL